MSGSCGSSQIRSPHFPQRVWPSFFSLGVSTCASTVATIGAAKNPVNMKNKPSQRPRKKRDPPEYNAALANPPTITETMMRSHARSIFIGYSHGPQLPSSRARSNGPTLQSRSRSVGQVSEGSSGTHGSGQESQLPSRTARSNASTCPL